MNSIIAIAKTVLKEIIRMRVLMFFILLYILGFTVFFAMWLDVGTTRPDEKVQTFISYSVSAATVLLSFSTIFLAVATVTRDIKRKEIFTIATKSVSRLGYLAGKFLGISIFNLIVLLISFTLIYFTAGNIGKKEVAKQPEEQQAYFADRIDSLVLTARQGIAPTIPSFQQQIDDEVERMVADEIRRYPNISSEPELIENLRQHLIADAQSTLRKGFLTVKVGDYKVFEFNNVKVLPGQEFVYLRYNMDVSVNPENLKAFGLWLIGPEDPTADKSGTVFQTYDTVNVFHEHRIPAELVSPEGKLFVAYRNPFENVRSSILFSNKNGLEVLYTSGTFLANLGRAFCLIFFRLIFLTIIALAFGALLSFPVAVLAVMVAFIIGICSSFFLDAIGSTFGNTSANVVEAVMLLFPQLSKYDPSYLLEKGRMIEPMLVYSCLANLVLLKAGFVGALGFLAFRRKELARVIV